MKDYVAMVFLNGLKKMYLDENGKVKDSIGLC